VQVSRRAGADCPHCVLLLRVHAQHEDAAARLLAAQLLDEIEPRAAGHREIEHDHVEMAGTHAFQYLVPVRRLLRDENVPGVREDLAQPFAHDLVIVGEQHFDHATDSSRPNGSSGRSITTAMP
jgi:hypothetical protein